MEIFPSRFIHIGGDEAPKKNWKNCKLCQEKIKENNLKDEEELQVYFFNHFQKFLSSHNKIAIGWNEILHKNLNKGAVIQHWKPNTNRKTVKYVNLGQRTIISNFMYLYLDYPYAMTPLSKTYNFEPILKGIKKPDNIIGVETPLWTEWVQNRSKIDFQTFPRLAAVSEIAWTEKEHKDYDDFCRRLQALYHHYDELGINYAKGMEKQPPLLKRIVETRKWWKDENVEIDKN
jgi:hexosaminidase